MWRRRTSECFPQGLCIPAEDNKPVPLKDIKVVASIEGFVCKVTSTLLYENCEDKAIEATFVFPMDDACAVYEFEAELDERKIVAECEDSDEAKNTYEDAVSQGFTSVLLNQDRNSGDIFEMIIGNLPPQKSATIRFSYVQELPLLMDGGVSFVLPTLLNPRYNPALEDGGVKDSRKDAGAGVRPNAVPYTFQFEAVVSSGTNILNVKSTYEDVKAEILGDKTNAVLTLKKDFCPDHDLSFVMYFDKINEPAAIIAAGDKDANGILKSDIIMLNFFPQLDDNTRCGEKEFIFVIDRSGSMNGERMISAKETLLLFLKSLPADCFFNIVSFGSRHDFLFTNGSQRYSEDTLRQACDLQRDMGANYGGTEILQPLNDIYEQALIEGYPRQCFVLTDGMVSNVNKVIALVKKNAHQARVFTFGIGEGASTSLVKGLARAGQGKAMFVKDDERLQPKVMKMLKCAMQDGVKDVKVELPQPAQFIPQPVPPLFSGDCLIMYAILPSIDKNFLEQGNAVLSGSVAEKSVQFTVPLKSAGVSRRNSSDMAIHRLAAKAQISHLQEDDDTGNDNKVSDKAKIILLSTSANIVSRYTSMVGVDTEKVGSGSEAPKKRRIPVPIGIRMHQPMLMACSAPMRMACAAPQMMYANDAPKMMSKQSKQKSSVSSGGKSSVFSLMSARQCGSVPPPPVRGVHSAPPPPVMDALSSLPPPSPCGFSAQASQSHPSYSFVPQPVVEGYMEVVALQKFSGEWLLEESLALLLKVSLHELQTKCPPQVANNVWATALAISFLQSKYSEQHDEWEMVEMKAIQWLNNTGADINTVLEKARNIYK